MVLNRHIINQINLTVFVLLLTLAKGFQERDYKSTATPISTTGTYNDNAEQKSNNLLNKNQPPSLLDAGDAENDNNGLIEVKEDEIPEGAMVYVLEEPIDTPTDGEILKTASNIVFRPLFRYREKQEAQRRNYNNRVRRRYFVPRRSYRHTYYPYYYPYRYY